MFRRKTALRGESARDHVRRRVRVLRWRIRLRRGIEGGTRFLLWSVVADLALVLVLRVAGVAAPLGLPIGALLAGGTLIGVLLGVFRRVTPFSAALVADEQLGLRERLSSALTLPLGDSEMVRALHTDAQRYARQLRTAEAVPIAVPRRARFIPIPAAALLLAALLLPPLDLLHGRTDREIPQTDRKEVTEQAKKLEEARKKVAAAKEIEPATAVLQLSEEIKRISDQLGKERLDRTQALAKVSNLADKVEEQREKLLEKTDMKHSLDGMRDFEQAGDLAEALKDQDFKVAAEELEKMAEKAKTGELEDSEREDLAKELEEMARLLEDNPKLSKALADLARSLRMKDLGALELSLDDSLMSLADLKDALEQLALLDSMLKDVSFSKLALAGQIVPCTACQGCGKCPMCQGSGTCPGCGGSGKDGQGGTCSVCGGDGLCPLCRGSGGCGMCGGAGYCQSGRPGVGMGMGHGLGPRPTDDSITTAYKNTGIRGQIRPGEILAAIKVKGDQVRGESEIEISEAYLELRQSEERAISRERIPAGMKDRVKAYFDAIDPHAPGAEPAVVEAEGDAEAQE